MYTEEIKKLEQRLAEIQIELQQQGVDAVALKNEQDFIIKKIEYLKHEILRQELFEAYYKSKEALDKAKKELEEAGFYLEQESLATQRKIKSSNATRLTLVGIIGVSCLAYVLLSKKK